MNSPQATQISQFKYYTFGLVSRIGKKDFINYRKPIWLTGIKETFKFSPHVHLFGQLNYLYILSSGYSNLPTHKWYNCISFQASRKGFGELQEVKWLNVINEIFKIALQLDPFCQVNYFYEHSSGYPNRLVKNFIPQNQVIWGHAIEIIYMSSRTSLQ